MYTLTLPYPPSTNRYWRSYGGRVVVSQEARDYKEEARLLAWAICPRAVTGNVAVHVHVYRPQRRGDLDNCLKVLFDALNGVAYEDDSQIIAIHAYRHEDKHNPRVVVTVEEVK